LLRRIHNPVKGFYRTIDQTPGPFGGLERQQRRYGVVKIRLWLLDRRLWRRKFQFPDDFDSAVPIAYATTGRGVFQGLRFKPLAGPVDPFVMDGALGLARAILRTRSCPGTTGAVTAEYVQHIADSSPPGTNVKLTWGTD